MANKTQRRIVYTIPFLLLLCLFARESVAQVQGEDALPKESIPDVVIANNAFSITAFGNQIVDQDTILYVTERNQIARYDAKRNVLLNMFNPPSPVGFFVPLGMALGPDGHLYVSSRRKIYRFNAISGNFIDEFIPEVRGLAFSTLGLLFGPDGNLYISNFSTDEVLRYDGMTGAFIDAFVSAGAGGLDYPQDIAFGPDGHLFVCSVGNNAVLKFDGSTGEFINVFTEEDCGDEALPRSIGFDAADNLYLVRPGTVFSDDSTTANLVLRYNGTTGESIGAFIQENAVAGEKGFTTFAFGPTVGFFLRNENKLQRYHLLTGSLTRNVIDVPQARLSTGLDRHIRPRLAFGPDNNLYVLDDKGISRYDTHTGAYIDLVVAGADFHDFAIDEEGSILIPTSKENTVQKYTSAGEYVGRFISGSSELEHPTYVGFAPNNDLFVASNRAGIFLFDGQTGEFTKKVNGPGNDHAGRLFAFGPNETIYTQNSGDRIFIHDMITGRFLGVFVSFDISNGIQLTELTFGPDQNLFVIRNEERIESYRKETGELVRVFANKGTEDTFNPVNFTFGPDGALYVVDLASKQVLRYAGPAITSVSNAEQVTTGSFSLSPNYPNPFSTTTSISYHLASGERVRIEVFDILGRRVALLKDESQRSGSYTLHWHPSINVSSGLYLLRATVGRDTHSIPMLKY